MALSICVEDAELSLRELLDLMKTDHQEIVFLEAALEVARLAPIQRESAALSEVKPKNPMGIIWISDDFNDPLPDEEISLFEDSNIFPEETDIVANPTFSKRSPGAWIGKFAVNGDIFEPMSEKEIKLFTEEDDPLWKR